MDKRILTCIFILVIALSGCTQAVSITPSIIPISGIEGYVTEGPMCTVPVAIGDTNCQDQPYQATLSVLGTDNQEVSRFQTDLAGHFKITLAPGTYTLHPLSDKTLPRASDQNVVVTLNQFTQVTVVYDTGMR